ncbi:hypothetical protein Bca101_020797 [Brassica carinata]
MAFCKSLGGKLRQGAVSQTSNVLVQSMLGSLWYISTKLFVGGLSWGTDDQSLREAFSNFGEVINSKSAANAAISEMDGKELNGRTEPSAPRAYGEGGGYGGGGGGYGGAMEEVAMEEVVMEAVTKQRSFL